MTSDWREGSRQLFGHPLRLGPKERTVKKLLPYLLLPAVCALGCRHSAPLEVTNPGSPSSSPAAPTRTFPPPVPEIPTQRATDVPPANPAFDRVCAAEKDPPLITPRQAEGVEQKRVQCLAISSNTVVAGNSRDGPTGDSVRPVDRAVPVVPPAQEPPKTDVAHKAKGSAKEGPPPKAH